MTEATPAAGGAPLTVVLVHGAFADASCWTGVLELLNAAGIANTAPPNPLRGLSIDAPYIASYLNQIPGPVLLVGHSYGGAVITNAGSRAKNVVGLVYVAAFAPDEGEILLDIEKNSRDSVLLTALMPLQYPTGNGTETATEFAIIPEGSGSILCRPLPKPKRDHRVHPASDRGTRFWRADHEPRLEVAPVVGRSAHRRQGRRVRRRAFHG